MHITILLGMGSDMILGCENIMGNMRINQPFFSDKSISSCKILMLQKKHYLEKMVILFAQSVITQGPHSFF
jgi:hypothetical protein